MKPIVTLTLNPSVDGACAADEVRPTHKVRTTDARYDPGGGGINVARVISTLGGPALPVYLAGGATGALLEDLLEGFDFLTQPIRIRDLTRISLAVFDRSSGLEYRFVPEGPQISDAEWQSCLAALDALDFDYLVASGSRPAGLGDDCYRDVVALAQRKNARVMLDTSGPALAATLEGGGIHLVKPSLGEFRHLCGEPLEQIADVEKAARARVDGGQANIFAITMGHRGALLVSRDGTEHVAPPDVEVRSAVGAGDSFLGGMTLALARGDTVQQAFRYGMAAGTAAVMSPGTELCSLADVEALLSRLSS